MRTVVCGVFFIQYALALVYLPMIAYLFQHWRKLQLAISIPNALLLVFIGFVPESPQWLLYMQHQEHAENILRFAANFNDRNIPASFCLRRVQLPGEGAGEVIPQRNTIFAILKDCYLLKITLILMVLWTGLIFCYSVIILYLVYLNHNVYCTLMMTGGLQLVAFSITVPLMHRFSHSRTVLVSVIFCALSLCPVFFLSNVGPYSLGHPVVIVLLFSMFPCAMTMAALWNYSARVYPTGLRCQAFGIMTLFGHLGSLFTPVYLTKIVKVPVTSVIILMGVYVALGVFALGLTDCRNRELPDTIMDAEHYKQRVKPMRWTTVCIYSSKSEEKELRVIEFDSETEYT